MRGIGNAEIEGIKENFFAAPNQLTWEKISSGKTPLAEGMRDSIERLRTDADTLLLPRKSSSSLDWYAVAFDERGMAELAEQLRCFVGPTYSTFDGRRAELDPSDAIEAYLSSQFGARVFKLGCHDGRSLTDAISRMLTVRGKSKRRASAQHRSVAQLLDSFERALVVGNRTEAIDILDELNKGNLLEPVNLQFLRVRLHAALEEWTTLVHLQSFEHLCELRRPVPVSRAMLIALYRTYFAGFEHEQNAIGALEYYRREIASKYRGLFASPEGLRDVEVLKLFMMQAAGPPSLPEMRDSLLQVECDDRDFLLELAKLTPGEPTASEEQAWDEMQAGRVGSGAAIAEKLEDGSAKAELLLDAAFELRSLDPVAEGLVALSRLPAGEQELLTAGVAQAALNDLVGSSDRVAPTGWIAWLEFASKSDWSDQQARLFAQDGAAIWSTEDIATDPAIFIRAFEKCLNEAPSRLTSAIPHVIATLISERDFPRPAFGDLYETLRVALLTDLMLGTPSDVALLTILSEAALVGGLKGKPYQSLVEELIAAFAQYEAPKAVDEWLDLTDLLLTYPAPEAKDRQIRQAFGQRVVTTAAGWMEAGRLPVHVPPVLRVLAHDFQLDDIIRQQVDDQEELNTFDRLNGVIGIYTLTESVGDRVRRILEVEAPHAQVRVNSEKDGSAELKALVRSADVMVVCTRSAKHAATLFVAAHRPSNLPTLYPDGKGSSSILRELSQFAFAL